MTPSPKPPRYPLTDEGRRSSDGSAAAASVQNVPRGTVGWVVAGLFDIAGSGRDVRTVRVLGIFPDGLDAACRLLRKFRGFGLGMDDDAGTTWPTFLDFGSGEIGRQ